MPFDTTVVVTTTWSCMNPLDIALGAVSLYAIQGGIMVLFSSSSTPPSLAAGELLAIPLPPAWQGGGIINQTLASLVPGASAPTYIHARLAHGSPGATQPNDQNALLRVSCA